MQFIYYSLCLFILGGRGQIECTTYKTSEKKMSKINGAHCSRGNMEKWKWKK